MVTEMLMDCKYVLWDWNGTLLDDVELNIDVVNRMLSDRGLEPLPSREFYTDNFGFPVIDFYRAAGFDFSNEAFESAADDYVMWYRRFFDRAGLFPHTVQTLEAVKSGGIGQAILSATKLTNLLSQVESFGIEHFFDSILGVSDSLGSGKTELARQWLDKSGMSPGDIVVVGDTLHDFEVSRALGCRCILVSSGHQSRSRLEKTGAAVVDNVGCIMEYAGVRLKEVEL